MKIRFLLQPTSRITLKQETSLLDVFTSMAVRLLLSLKRGRERQKGACFLGVRCYNYFSDKEKMIVRLCKISLRSLRTWGTSLWMLLRGNVVSFCVLRGFLFLLFSFYFFVPAFLAVSLIIITNV